MTVRLWPSRSCRSRAKRRRSSATASRATSSRALHEVAVELHQPPEGEHHEADRERRRGQRDRRARVASRSTTFVAARERPCRARIQATAARPRQPHRAGDRREDEQQRPALAVGQRQRGRRSAVSDGELTARPSARRLERRALARRSGCRARRTRATPTAHAAARSGDGCEPARSRSGNSSHRNETLIAIRLRRRSRGGHRDRRPGMNMPVGSNALACAARRRRRSSASLIGVSRAATSERR